MVCDIVLELKGRNNYIKWTLKQWFYEIKDLLENEYNTKLCLKDIESLDEDPSIEYRGEVVVVGLPGEEGYLIELLKKLLDRIIKART